MGKAILLCRVSTEEQDIDQQTERVLEAARKDGYLDEDIISVSAKESGISLREEDRQSINEMKHLIESDSTIDCVYIYEPSRLARRADVNSSVKQYLVDRKIQLVCLKPEFRLLDVDGKVNPTANIVFGIFTTISETEMYNTRDRMLRGKLHALTQGRIVNGKVLFGYKLDKTKHIMISDKEAKIVHDCFDMMVSGNHSYTTIAKELNERGDFDTLDNRKKVHNILKCHEYYGGKSPKNKYQHIYPPIITKDIFDRVQKQIASNNKFKEKKQFKNIFLGRALIRDTNGYLMIGKDRKDSSYYQNHRSSNSHMCIGSEAMDNAIWLISSSRYQDARTINQQNNVDRTNDNIKIIKSKILHSKEIIDGLQAKIDRVEVRFIEGKISEVKADQLESDYKKQRRIEDNNIIKYNEQLRQLESPVNESSKYEDLKSITDPELRYKIVRMVIDHIDAKTIKKSYHEIIVHYKPYYDGEGADQKFLLCSRRGKKSLSLEDGWTIDL